jgi:hypothetical protein
MTRDVSGWGEPNLLQLVLLGLLVLASFRRLAVQLLCRELCAGGVNSGLRSGRARCAIVEGCESSSGRAGTISAEGTCLEVEERFLETRHDEQSQGY